MHACTTQAPLHHASGPPPSCGRLMQMMTMTGRSLRPHRSSRSHAAVGGRRRVVGVRASASAQGKKVVVVGGGWAGGPTHQGLWLTAAVMPPGGGGGAVTLRAVSIKHWGAVCGAGHTCEHAMRCKPADVAPRGLNTPAGFLPRPRGLNTPAGFLPRPRSLNIPAGFLPHPCGLNPPHTAQDSAPPST